MRQGATLRLRGGGDTAGDDLTEIDVEVDDDEEGGRDGHAGANHGAAVAAAGGDGGNSGSSGGGESSGYDVGSATWTGFDAAAGMQVPPWMQRLQADRRVVRVLWADRCLVHTAAYVRLSVLRRTRALLSSDVPLTVIGQPVQ